jgi:hypothetical protein
VGDKPVLAVSIWLSASACDPRSVVAYDSGGEILTALEQRNKQQRQSNKLHNNESRDVFIDRSNLEAFIITKPESFYRQYSK